MTTIIVIVVVALVFFVTICVVSLLIWKRETEMRTDSLKAIEQNLEAMLSELSDERQLQKRNSRQNLYGPDIEETIRQVADRSSAALRGTGRRRSADPFAWVKTQRTSDKNLKAAQEQEIPEKSVFEKIVDGIDEERSHEESSWKPSMDVEELQKDYPVEENVEELKDVPEIESETAEQAGTELCEMEEIVLPDISELEKKEELETLSLDESFKEIENLINSLTEEAEDENVKSDVEADDEDPIDQYMEEIPLGPEEQPAVKHMGYDTGRSGRKYTAEELEALIKE